ncbi:MAG: tRNA uridine-5-carboxymethylaminomethyl(34) synthesis GTPase MnmE, partial [Lentisphaeria bacterium]|nr:tRNA uridine-5-carboxymethylaminomethyl(34) synthesis GTPase MnmE [Lentisphaeria bacterium]
MGIFSKNLFTADDTAAALCTAPGGAISVIRITGKNALDVAEKVWKGKNSLRKKENCRKVLLGKTIAGEEPCLAFYMKAPHSYTGDDTVELQCHGGSIAPGRLLKAVFEAGARPAEEGEFTRRAFLNGKLDLTQAEAVADLISAKSNAAADLALRQLSGVLRDEIGSSRDILLSVLAEIESRMDFPEEDLNWQSTSFLLSEIEKVCRKLEKMISSRQRGQVLREGVKLVIAGRPNSGKSSLLNMLLGYERAIVTEIAGTTRDTLEEMASFRNIPVRISDTAGVREETSDRIEKIGIQRSRESIRQAEILFWVADLSDEDTVKDPFGPVEEVEKNSRIILVWNKSDLPETLALNIPEKGFYEMKNGRRIPSVRISAKKNEGVELLLDVFQDEVLSGGEFSSGECEISLRHGEKMEKALTALQEAYGVLSEEEWALLHRPFQCRTAACVADPNHPIGQAWAV